MKFSSTLLILLATATLFQGCGETEEAVAADTQTVIDGSTTLASGLRSESKTTVCLDLNDNQTCDEDEPVTETDLSGRYSFTVPGSVEDGMVLIVQDGMNILPLPEGVEHENLKFYKSYQNSESSQNINILSTLIVNEMVQNPDNSYSEIKDNIANTYSIDPAVANTDPLYTGGDFLKRVIGLQVLVYEQNATQIQSSPALFRATAQQDETLPTSDELDTFVTDNAGYLDAFLATLGEYIDALLAWYDSLWADDEEIIVEVPVVDQPEIMPITRDALNGVWYIIDASGDKTCSYIKDNDDISVTEADGATTDLSLTYIQNDELASMELSLSFFSVDTIVFTEYKSDYTFKGHYASDNETLSGEKVSSLDTCKSEKLGL